jgi:hypothetical protein
MSYQSDRNWAEQYMPDVCSIVGPRLLVPAPLRRDMHEATDLIVLTGKDLTIAVRLRRFGYAGRYPYDVTIRTDRPSGVPTEQEKICRGFGDWFFYGHETGLPGPRLAPWYIIDLAALRFLFQCHPRLLREDGEWWGKRDNPDGTSFRFYDVRGLHRHCPGVLIASHWPSAAAAQEAAA